jgi:hypothetical protein
LVAAASMLSKQHLEVKTMISWLSQDSMSEYSSLTCLPVDCCFSELALLYKNSAMHIAIIGLEQNDGIIIDLIKSKVLVFTVIQEHKKKSFCVKTKTTPYK